MPSNMIQQQADTVLNETGEHTLPVDIEKIATHYGIRISEVPNEDDLSGLLLKSNGKTIIGINSLHGKNRKRFTIAHELGHYFLHQGQDTFVDDKVSLEFVKFRHKALSSPEERDANSFAAALLMPSDLLIDAFSKIRDLVDDSGELINLLAKKCEVSTDAMRYRLVNLNLIHEA